MVEYVPLLLDGLAVTLRVAALSALLGGVLAVAAGLGRLSRYRAVRAAVGTYVEVFRGTSAIVQLFWIFFALPLVGVSLPTMTAAVLALGLNVGAYGAEIVRGAVKAVPAEQWDAAIALNFTPAQRMRRIILPQALRTMLPPAGNLLVELLKGTSLVSLVTLSDLTFRAQLLVTSTLDTTRIFGLVLLMYFVVAFALTRSVRWLERRVSVGADYRATALDRSLR